eukprot:2845352-Pyramimonas_sp.AAC.1
MYFSLLGAKSSEARQLGLPLHIGSMQSSVESCCAGAFRFALSSGRLGTRRRKKGLRRSGRSLASTVKQAAHGGAEGAGDGG